MLSSVRRRPLSVAAFVLLTLAFVPLSAQNTSERVDLDAIYRIKEEGFQRSQVMDVTSWLTDVYGPRLTNSPGFRKAGEWAVAEMKKWGLANVALDPFAFGRGWSNDKYYAMATAPGGSFPIIGLPSAWTPGTNGLVSGRAVHAVMETDEDLAKYKGQLGGTFVLAAAMRDVAALWTAPADRYTDEELRALERENDAAPRVRRGERAGARGRQGGPGRGTNPQQTFAQRRTQFFKSEGVLGVITPGRGDGGTVFVSGGGGSRQADAPPGVPTFVIAVEHYGRLLRTLERGMPVTIEMDVRNSFHDDATAFNILAEIPGTDKADEVVMLGAHFDSWHGGTGATDNAAGCAVMMEAMRILKASGVRLRRTVRIGLWGGEEQGLLGSRDYVRRNFADPETMKLLPGHEKLTGYFNVDNGTGAIRGIYLQGNEAVRPIFGAWMQPLRDLGMTTVTIRDTSGTDHQAFDRVGLPGFQFIQDGVEYSTRTHHSTMDVYERIQEEDMRKNAVIVAVFAYHAANREERLPRKPLPPPQPPRGTGTQQ